MVITVEIREGETGTISINGYNVGLPPMKIKSPCRLKGFTDAAGEPVIKNVAGFDEARILTIQPKYEIGDLVEWEGGHFLVIGYNQEDSDLVWRNEYRMLSPVTGSVIDFSINFIDNKATLVA